MADALLIETGWPAPILSPNASRTRDFWSRKRAKDAAKTEGFLAACAALGRNQFAPHDARIRVTIHAHPPTNRTRDDDNFTAQCKALLDGIARRLKVDDSRFELQPVQWHPAGKPGGVVIEIEVQP